MTPAGGGRESRSLRIAMIAPPCVPVPPPQYGGTELVIAELIDGLTARGAEVTLFASGNSTGGFRTDVPVEAVFDKAPWPPAPLVELVHSTFAFQELLQRADEFDVVHTHCPTFLPLASMLPLPVVFTMHGARTDELAHLYHSARDISYVAISARQAELNGPFHRCSVVHHGLDPRRYRLGRVQEDSVAFLGRLSECKAPHVAVDVARAAGLRLRVGGRPHAEDTTYFAKTCEAALRQRHVEWLGEVPHEPKVELLSTSRAMLFPIEWEEPFGLVVIESMLCGCPVIAFERGAVPEIVDEGITGFIARDADDMVRLLRGPASPERFDRERCRAHAARRFASDRMVSAYLGVYEAARAQASTFDDAFAGEAPPA